MEALGARCSYVLYGPMNLPGFLSVRSCGVMCCVLRRRACLFIKVLEKHFCRSCTAAKLGARLGYLLSQPTNRLTSRGSHIDGGDKTSCLHENCESVEGK